MQLIDYFRLAMKMATNQLKWKQGQVNVAATGQIKKRKLFLCSPLSSGIIILQVTGLPCKLQALTLSQKLG